MSRSRLLNLLLAVYLAAVAAPAAPIEHFGLAETDEYLLCLRALLGKPVFRDGSSFLETAATRPRRIDLHFVAPHCPSSREDLLLNLKARDETLLETEDWAFIHPTRFLKNDGPLDPLPPLINWKRLVLTIDARNWGGIPGTRELTPKELASIGRAVFRDARTTSILTHRQADVEGARAVDYLVRATAVPLAPNGAEAVIGILGQPGWTCRLVYGELHGGEYRIVWDSPQFYALMLEVGFQDVDGDGTKEILIKSAYNSMNPTSLMLTIFDTRGHELTRQRSCEFDPTWGYDKVGMVCPVVGEEITVDDSRSGKRDLLVRRMDDLDHPKLNRYTLCDGHFVNVGVVKEQP